MLRNQSRLDYNLLIQFQVIFAIKNSSLTMAHVCLSLWIVTCPYPTNSFETCHFDLNQINLSQIRGYLHETPNFFFLIKKFLNWSWKHLFVQNCHYFHIMICNFHLLRKCVSHYANIAIIAFMFIKCPWRFWCMTL